MRALSFVILTTALFWPVAASAQLNVLISGGFSGAYEKLLPEFERTSRIKVTQGRVRRREQGRKRLPRSSPAACLLTWWSSPGRASVS
jgi:hypothetical protein